MMSSYFDFSDFLVFRRLGLVIDDDCGFERERLSFVGNRRGFDF